MTRVAPAEHVGREIGHEVAERGSEVVGRVDLVAHLGEGNVLAVVREDAYR